MFEKIGRLAETMATNVSVSWRGFIGRLGKGALLAAGALAGALATTGQAQAGPPFSHCIQICVNACVLAGGTPEACRDSCKAQCS